MSTPQNFRSAFNGFHREDVVRYLEYLNSRHHAQVEQLTAENEYLRSQVSGGNAAQELEALRAQLEELQSIRTALEARCAAMEQELEQAQAGAGHCRVEQELEAYRRAERMERQARERAEQVNSRTNGILADAAVKLDTAAGDVASLANSVLAQLEQLCSAVDSSKQVLQNASQALYGVGAEEP